MKEVISYARSEIKSVLENSLLLVLEKCVMYSVYNDPGIPPEVGGTSLYNATMRRDASPFTLNVLHSNLHRLELSLPESNFSRQYFWLQGW